MISKNQINPHTRSEYLHKLMAADLARIITEPVVREYKAIPGRQFRFDLAYIKSKILIEIHGGTWSGGRHTRGIGFKDDREKMNEAQTLGYDVYEFTSEDVENGRAAEAVARYYRIKENIPVDDKQN